MIQQNTSVRALVPYQNPKISFWSRLKSIVHVISVTLYSFYGKRRLQYVIFLLVYAVGALVGAYYFDLHSVSASFSDSMMLFRSALCISFVFGFTVFGIAIVPICTLLTAFACSFTFRLMLAPASLLSCLFLLLYIMLLILSFVESFGASVRSFHGFRAVFYSRSVIFHLALFVFLLSLANFVL